MYCCITMKKLINDSEEIHERTRVVYEKQHDRIAKDDDAFNRISGLYSASGFNLKPKWFKNKKALDAGCGNFGALMVKLAQLGVSKVYGIDLGYSWIKKLKLSLTRHKIKPSQYELKSGSVLNIPYKNGYFDFVSINGVLTHLANMSEIIRGFSEGARVCKKGGYYHTSYGPCRGVVIGVIFPALQKYYRENKEFKDFIDNLNPGQIHKTINKICSDLKKFNNETNDAESMKSMFGEDFCVFLQNYIQRPTDFSNECTPELVEELYRIHGFKEITRINKYVKRSDIRKYFAPLHYDRDFFMSKILYGKGFVEYIAKKA